MTVKLISVTPDAEKTMAFIARVSNPANQDNENYSKLLAYCIKHNHWSVFEQSSMTLEIETNRGIAAQILRHRSFTYQEFSQRYADASLLTEEIPVPELRKQDTKNRQNSTDDLVETLGPEKLAGFYRRTSQLFEEAEHLYSEMVSQGIAKECARNILPLGTQTRLYMNGTIRSYIHYLQVRTDPSTQLEHREIALAIKDIFCKQFPIIGEAVFSDQ